jgi:uncharacterized oxidoreductase
MQTQNNTILITGGATGIGFALAESFVRLGNKVIICGRRQAKLDEAKKKLPGIETHKCDISKEKDRQELFNWVSANFKDTNILLNNAGIQRPIDFRKGIGDLLQADDEIETNLKAQIHLSAYFIPLLSKQKESAIINVSSGLGFVPLAVFPIYCATKAAIHSFSISLRHQLRETSIKVFEIIPPTVYDTELKGKPMQKNDWSISAVEVADVVIKGWKNDEYEIAIGPAKDLVANSRKDPEGAFKGMNSR